MAVQNNNEVTGWTGWIYFAGLLMILRGLSGAFLGLTALVNKQYLLVTGPNAAVLATANVQTWGWVHLAISVLVLAAGFSVLHGSRWARIVAIIFASLAFMANLAFVAVFPIWAVVAMVVDVLVIYALVVHGNEVA